MNGNSIFDIRPDESLPDRFAHIVQARGSRQALASEAWNPTYQDLNAAADSLACALHNRPGNVGDRIAILMQHDARQVAAMVAVLKAGRTVVVLNPSDAAARLRLILDDAAPALVLTDSTNAALADEISRNFCASEAFDDLDVFERWQKITINPQSTCFIVYTSGSSGRPKGVMMNHHQVMHNALRLSRAMELGVDSRVALLPSLSGLHGVNNAWCSLLHGACLFPFPVMDRGVTGLAEWMTENKISAFSASTSLFRVFMKSLKKWHCIEPVRMVRIGGELVTSEDFNGFCEHFHKDCIFLNTLASSEAGNIASQRYAVSDQAVEGPLAVGRVFEGVEIIIADEDGRPVRHGEAGQIVIKSPYLSQGYWRNEHLTAARYFRDSRGTPMLKSGDWGRMNAAGCLEFVGRRDTRVKVHGSSVELDEVEQALCRVPGVNTAVVCAWDGPNGTELVAYVALNPGIALSALAIRRGARALLPEHMVPSYFEIISDLPLSSHGKIDRQKLLQTRPPTAQQRPVVAFQSNEEMLLAEIWAGAFDLPSVGRDDNFFELGGNSLIASVIAAGLYSETGVEINLDTFATCPTVASMAMVAAGMRKSKRDAFQIRAVSRDQPLPLSFTQERIWNYSQADREGINYIQVGRSKILGTLREDVLRRCLNYLARRHEQLRTTFDVFEGGPVQLVHQPRDVDFTSVDFSHASDPVGALRELANAQKLDLREGPLVRFTLIKISEREHWLLRLMHHILYDARSWNLYLEELVQLYEAFVHGAEFPLGPVEALQYADYAFWQRQFFRAEVQSCRNIISWWKRTLDNSPRDLELPFKKRTPGTLVDPREADISLPTARDVSQRLSEIARQQNATSFQIGLAIFVAFIAAKIGQQDIIIGSYVSNRKRLQLQKMFGDFSNLITLRFNCDFRKTLRSWIVSVRDSVLETYAYSELPYEELRRAFELDGRTLPEIRAIFGVAVTFPAMHFAGLELTSEERIRLSMPWGFTFSQDEGSFEGNASFDASIYDPDSVRTTLRQWSRFTEIVTKNPDLPLTDLLALCDLL